MSEPYRSKAQTSMHAWQDMDIELNPAEAGLNLMQQDEVTFEEAAPALLDPYAWTCEDVRADGKPRFVTFGMGGKGRLLVVAWTCRGDDSSLKGSRATVESPGTVVLPRYSAAHLI